MCLRRSSTLGLWIHTSTANQRDKRILSRGVRCACGRDQKVGREVVGRQPIVGSGLAQTWDLEGFLRHGEDLDSGIAGDWRPVADLRSQINRGGREACRGRCAKVRKVALSSELLKNCKCARSTGWEC